MFCPKCGKELADGSTFCPLCGTSLGNGAPVQASQGTRYNTFAIVGFVIGILSLLINFFGLVGIAAVIVSVVGLKQVQENNEKGKGLAIAGLVIGIFSVIYGVISLLSL